jgi:hypothetical protein
MKPITDIAIVPRQPRWPVRLDPVAPPSLRKVVRDTAPSTTTEQAMEPITETITGAAPAAGDITGKPSWRDLIKVHPAADAFPMLSEEELDALAEDIKAHGLTDPVTTWVDKDGTEWLLDGRNRLDAMAAAGYHFKLHGQLISSGPDKGTREPERFKVLPPNGLSKWAIAYVHPYYGADPYAFVISANIHRRHLSTEDRKRIAVELLKANPERSNRAIAEEVQLDKNTVAQVRKDAEARGEIHHVETRRSGAAGTPPPPARQDAQAGRSRSRAAAANRPDPRPDASRRDETRGGPAVRPHGAVGSAPRRDSPRLTPEEHQSALR